MTEVFFPLFLTSRLHPEITMFSCLRVIRSFYFRKGEHTRATSAKQLERDQNRREQTDCSALVATTRATPREKHRNE
jgi:hypothetical protein